MQFLKKHTLISFGFDLLVRIYATLSLARYWRDESGNVAPIFAALLLPILGLAGAAYDYSNASSIEAKLQSSLDAAGLAAARDGTTTQSLQRIAEDWFETNYPDNTPKLAFIVSGKELQLSAKEVVPTAFLGILGKTEFKIEVATVIKSDRPFGSGSVATVGSNKPSSGNSKQLARKLDVQIARLERRIKRRIRNWPHTSRIKVERQLKAYIEQLRAGNATTARTFRLAE